MEEEKKEVNNTGLEVKEEEGTPMPTIDPKTGEVSEVEPEPKKEEAKSEEGENWEERYKNLQSHSDKQIADKEKELGKLKNLVSPFQRNVKTAEDGSLVFDFSDTSPAKGKADEKKPAEEIQKPDKDLWLTNPEAATEQLIAFNRQEDKKVQDAEKEEQSATDADKAYKDGRAEGWNQAQKLYPDIKNKASEIFKVANTILENDPALAASPNCDLTVARLAASELGIAPAKVEEPTPAKEKKDTSYIIGGSSGSSGKPAKKLSEAEFSALSHDEQTEYMRVGFMKEE